MLPLFNSSNVNLDGYYRSFNRSHGQFSWQAVVSSFSLSGVLNSNSSDNPSAAIMKNCTQAVSQLMNVTPPAQPLFNSAALCVLNQLQGSFIEDESPIRAHAEMICATTTQVNMAPATIEMDPSGLLTHTITRLPRDLNIVQADYFESDHNTTSGDTVWFCIMYYLIFAQQ